MVPADPLLVIVWLMCVSTALAVTRHLWQDFGLLFASQGAVMLASGLVFVQCVRAGMSGSWAVILGASVGAILGAVHAPVAFRLGPELVVVVSAVSHFVLVDLWLAAPSLTGGSGGLLIPRATGLDVSLPLGGIALGYATLVLGRRRRATKVAFSLVRNYGPNAGSYGVPGKRIIVEACIVYGTVLGILACMSSGAVGYVEIGSFTIGFALSCVMLAVAASQSAPFSTLILVIIYVLGTTVARQLAPVGVVISELFELAFPAAVYILLLAKSDVKTGIRSQNRRSLV